MRLLAEEFGIIFPSMPFNLQKAIISSLKFPDSILIRFTTNKLFPSNKIAHILNAFFIIKSTLVSISALTPRNLGPDSNMPLYTDNPIFR